MLLLVQVGMKRDFRHLSLERHRVSSGGNRRKTQGKIKIDAPHKQQNSNHDSQDQALEHTCSPVPFGIAINCSEGAHKFGPSLTVSGPIVQAANSRPWL